MSIPQVIEPAPVPTGAGFAFSGAFLYAYIDGGAPPNSENNINSVAVIRLTPTNIRANSQTRSFMSILPPPKKGVRDKI
jgi:sugar/nucleoside kinase (ribokinase family)